MKNIVLNIIKSFFATFAVMGITGLETSNIFLLCVFAVSFILFNFRKKYIEKPEKRIVIQGIVLAVVFSVMYSLFADLTGGLENKAFRIIYLGCCLVGLFVIFFELVCSLYTQTHAFNSSKASSTT